MYSPGLCVALLQNKPPKRGFSRRDRRSPPKKSAFFRFVSFFLFYFLAARQAF